MAKENDKEKLDPPAFTLLNSIVAAWEAGVPAAEAVPLVKLAVAATGFKAPVWRTAASALDMATAKALEANGAARSAAPVPAPPKAV